jgi:hypothetical protein
LLYWNFDTETELSEQPPPEATCGLLWTGAMLYPSGPSAALSWPPLTRAFACIMPPEQEAQTWRRIPLFQALLLPYLL